MAARGTHRGRLDEGIAHGHGGLGRTAPHDGGGHRAGEGDQEVESELEAPVYPGGKSALEGSMARYRRTVSKHGFPPSRESRRGVVDLSNVDPKSLTIIGAGLAGALRATLDRKSTRLNSTHSCAFCMTPSH